MRPFLAVLALVALQATSASAAEIDLSKGRLTHLGNYSTQVVAVTNNTAAKMQAIKVECGFFQKGALQAAAIGIAQSVDARQTAYVEVIASDAPGADSADCRVSQIQ